MASAPPASSGSVREALEGAVAALAAAGVDSPRLDAELLLEAATGAGRGALLAAPDSPVEPAAARRFGTMVRRRLLREPVAYILGLRGFRRIELAVDPRVLIPRPETELLVEVALERDSLAVLDVGTGSGAVALAVADELERARVWATDTSADALEVARANAARLGLGDRVAFSFGSLPAAGRFDLLLANLPYVAAPEWEALEPEITRHEPREALVAGPGGLEAIEGLLEALAASPDPPTAIALEVGAGQAGAVAERVAAAGYGRPRARRDLAGIERVVIGERAR